MSLQDRIQEVIQASGASIGLALRHLETGQEIMLDADSYYALASVFKIPILVEAFFQISEGRLSLAERLPLKTEDKNLPSGVLVFFEDGLTPTVRDYLTMMTIISDNTATDVMIKRLGGTKAITRRMNSLGLAHTHISMTVRQLFDEIMPNADPTQDLYELEKSLMDLKRDPENRVYQLSPINNVATARDLTNLLQMIWEGKTPNRAGSDGALEILLKQQLNDRIPRFLPPGTRVAHKTGTLHGVRNDSGIIYAGEKAHVALTLLTRWEEGPDSGDPHAGPQASFNLDTAMGEIARVVYEEFAS
jgi:beta-lactamase class A